MATIYFNGKSFEIPEAALSVASGALRNHLSSVMNGTGAIVNFGGTVYNIDSTKLAAATNDLVSHLDKIVGTGSKVVIGGIEYPFDSSKIHGVISDLEAAFGNLSNSEGVDIVIILDDAILDEHVLE